MTILGLVAIGIITLMIRQNRNYHSEESQLEILANTSNAVRSITYLLRMAGCGCCKSFCPPHNETLDGANCGFNNVLTISNRSDGSDKLTIITAIHYSGKLAADSPAGNTTLRVEDNEADEFDTNLKRFLTLAPSHKSLFYEITNIENNPLVLTLNRPVKAAAGDRIYRVQAYTIALDTDDINNNGESSDDLDLNHNRAPDLYIYDNLTQATDSAGSLVAENIEDLQFRYAWDTNQNGVIDSNEWQDAPTGTDLSRIIAVRVFILARSRRPDRDFIDTHDDSPAQTGRQYIIADHTITLDCNDENGLDSPYDHHYHRNLTVSTITLRNLDLDQ